MATVEELRLEIKAVVGDAVSKLKSFDRQAKATESATKSMGSTFASLRDVMQGPIAAINMGIKAFKAIAAQVDKVEKAWADQEEALAILNSTLIATGASAWTSADKLEAMASALQSVTKYGDETITAMQNILLGFKNIKGDEFEEATVQILNMATVMKMDLKSAAQAVGKALDSPSKGMDSLSKQGFKFTEQEKELIKTLEESGRLEEAQGIILAELASTFGGAAEAAGSTASAIKGRLQNAIGDLNEELGRMVTEGLKDARLGMLEFTQDATAYLKESDNEVQAWIDTFKETGSAISAMFQGVDIGDDMKSISKDFRFIVDEINKAIRLFGSETGEELGAVMTFIKDTFHWISTTIGAYIDVYAGLAKGDWSRVWTGFQKIVLGFAKNALTILENIINAGGKFIQGFIDLYNKIDDKIKVLPDWDVVIKPVNLKALDDIEKRLKELSPEEIKIVGPKVPAGTAAPALAPSGEGGGFIAPDTEAQIDEANALAAAYSSAYATANDGLTKYTVQLTESQIIQQAMIESAVSGLMSMSEAFGAALVSGEEGWKAFGKAGLNAIAAVIEALAKQWMVSGLAALVPGIGFNPAAAVGYLAAAAAANVAAGAIKAIPMAEGGEGVVTKPTLFLAGEKGPEPYAFGGANNKRGMGKTEIHYHVAGSLLYEKQLSARMRGAIAYAGRDY